MSSFCFLIFFYWSQIFLSGIDRQVSDLKKYEKIKKYKKRFKNNEVCIVSILNNRYIHHIKLREI